MGSGTTSTRTVFTRKWSGRPKFSNLCKYREICKQIYHTVSNPRLYPRVRISAKTELPLFLITRKGRYRMLLKCSKKFPAKNKKQSKQKRRNAWKHLLLKRKLLKKRR